jgi:isocitrate dehydrogenase
MLRHLGERDIAAQIEAATAAVVAEGEVVTPDLKPGRPEAKVVGTTALADAIIANMETM